MPRISKEDPTNKKEKIIAEKENTKELKSTMLKKKTKVVVEAEMVELKPAKKEEKLEKEFQKAFFFPRLIAYIVDTIIITTLLSVILMVVPQSENYNTYLTEYQKLQTDFLEKKVTSDQYINRSIEVVHDIDYSNVISMIIEVVVVILYFIVFQYYNKGQTLGKKLMHIRVVSATDEELTFNHYVFRSCVINSLMAKVFIIGMVLFMNKQVYYYSSFGLQGLQISLIIISAFMAIYKKDGRGLQDLAGKTKVIMCDEV